MYISINQNFLIYQSNSETSQTIGPTSLPCYEQPPHAVTEALVRPKSFVLPLTSCTRVLGICQVVVSCILVYSQDLTPNHVDSVSTTVYFVTRHLHLHHDRTRLTHVAGHLIPCCSFLLAEGGRAEDTFRPGRSVAIKVLNIGCEAIGIRELRCMRFLSSTPHSESRPGVWDIIFFWHRQETLQTVIRSKPRPFVYRLLCTL